MNLTPGQSHVLTHFIEEEKQKFEEGRRLKKAQYQKQRYLKDNVLTLTPEQLIALQTEIKQLSDDFNRYYADWKGAKVRFVNLTKKFTSTTTAPVHVEIPQADASAQPTEEHASTVDVSQAAEENENTRADDCIPAAEEIARASTGGAPKENEEVRATASVVPEETEPKSSAPPAKSSQMKSIHLPST